MFEKLLILKIFKPEKFMFAASKYVETELGRVYAESPIATMDALFADSDNKTPLIFVLSSGADPTQ
jgi:dynein heavy chain